MEFEPAIYEAHVERLLRVVKDQEKAVKSLMLVGHNPGLADLMTMLVTRNQRGELPGKYPDRRPRGDRSAGRRLGGHHPAPRHAGALHHPEIAGR